MKKRATLSQVEEKFSDFFEKWMSQLEEYVEILVNTGSEKCQDHEGKKCEALVKKLIQHHKDYYAAKWDSAREEVLLFFAPVWLSPLEKAYSWMTGWKPSTIFRLVDSLKKSRVPGVNLPDLTDEQAQKIERLRVRIRVDEDKVEREMERQQVSMADRKMVELTRLVCSIEKGERQPSPEVDGMVEDALKALLAGLETVVRMADCVRLKTLKGVLDLLSPVQSADFLPASGILLIEMRKWGKKREERFENETPNIN